MCVCLLGEWVVDVVLESGGATNLPAIALQAFFVMNSGRGIGDLLGELRGAFATMLSPELADADASTELQVATAAFVVIATVMMLNLLVAMMSETFSTFSSADQGTRQWMLERARMILSIEHVSRRICTQHRRCRWAPSICASLRRVLA